MKLTTTILALALIGGCAANVGTASWPTSAPYSGFLADYSKLRPVPGLPGTLIHVDQSVNLRPYTRIIIDPVQIFLSENLDYRGLQPEVLLRMTETLSSGFQKVMQADYQVVKVAGPDVLRIRLAITQVHPVELPLKPTDFIPIKALVNAGRAATGESPHRVELSAEMEVLDAHGRVVMSGVATREGDRSLAQGDQITWADLTPILTAWANRFRQSLNDARGVGENQSSRKRLTMLTVRPTSSR